MRIITTLEYVSFIDKDEWDLTSAFKKSLSVNISGVEIVGINIHSDSGSIFKIYQMKNTGY